jgi:fumarate reductase flavoprotein subunit
LRERFGRLHLDDHGNVFNTNLLQVLELGAMLDVAEAMAQSALLRRESRGAHQRLDHPERDDARFLKHSLAHYRGAESPAIGYVDVVITRSPPGKRAYGGAAP